MLFTSVSENSLRPTKDLKMRMQVWECGPNCHYRITVLSSLELA